MKKYGKAYEKVITCFYTQVPEVIKFEKLKYLSLSSPIISLIIQRLNLCQSEKKKPMTTLGKTITNSLLKME